MKEAKPTFDDLCIRERWLRRRNAAQRFEGAAASIAFQRLCCRPEPKI